MDASTRPFRLFGRAPLLLAVLACVLSLPAIVGLARGNAQIIREEEHRDMAAFPPLSLWRKNPGQYIADWETYLKDSVGFRRLAITLRLKMRYHLFHDRPIDVITMGHDGHVFLNSLNFTPYAFFDALCVQAGDPRPELMRELDAVMAAASGYLRRRGARAVFAFVPTSPALYADKLPLDVPPALRRACLAYPDRDHAIARLKRQGEATGRYRVFHPVELFEAHKYEKHFWPKELFHWEGRSPYLFARHLLKESGALENVAFDDPAELVRAKDDLAVFFGFSRPIDAWAYPYADRPTELRFEKWLEEAFGKNRVNLHSHHITERSLTSETALMISDSFGDALKPHLARGFAHLYAFTTNVWAGKPADLFAAAARNIRPDYVFFVYNDTNITSLPRWLAPFVELEREAARQETSAGETVPAHGGSRGKPF